MTTKLEVIMFVYLRLFLMLTTRGPIGHSGLFWLIEKISRYDPQLFWVNLKEVRGECSDQKNNNFWCERMTSFGQLKLSKHYCHTTAEIHRSAVELVHRDLKELY